MKRLSIAEIVAKELIRENKTWFYIDDVMFLKRVFSECVHRKVMKKSSNDWKERVLAGVHRSKGFIQTDIKGRIICAIRV